MLTLSNRLFASGDWIVANQPPKLGSMNEAVRGIANCTIGTVVSPGSDSFPGLKTQRERGGYVIADSEGSKLARLFEKYGIERPPVNFVNSVNSAADEEPPRGGQDPLLI